MSEEEIEIIMKYVVNSIACNCRELHERPGEEDDLLSKIERQIKRYRELKMMIKEKK